MFGVKISYFCVYNCWEVYCIVSKIRKNVNIYMYVFFFYYGVF